MAVESFEDAFSSSCDCNVETLDWEWDIEGLAFKAVCSCMKQYQLTPITGTVEITDNETEDEDDDE